MAIYEKKNYWITVIALIVSVASAILAYLAIDASWKIAELSGSFDKSELTVGIGGFALPQNGVAQILVGAPVLSKDNVSVIGAIPYSIVSRGTRTAEGVTLNVQYHKMFKRSVLELMQRRTFGDFSATEIKRSFTEGDDLSFVSYRFPSLNPGISVLISEPLYLTDTKMHEEVPVTLKDGTNVIFPVEAIFSLNLALTINARDIPTATLPISVSIEKASSLKAMKTGRLPELINAERKKIRREISFVRYLGALLFSSPKAVIYLVYVPLEEVKVDELKMFGPKNKQEVAVVKYNLIAWDFLISTES